MPEPSGLARRLGSELQLARKLAGVSQHALAGRLGVTQATVSRVETARRLPTVAQARVWLAAAGDDQRAQVLGLLESALRETRPWAELPGTLQRWAAEENEASSRVCNYQERVVPGLLQTPEYAGAVFAGLGRDEGAAAVSVSQRMLRQQILYRPGRGFEFLLLDRVLDCAVAPHARAGQLAHLAGVATAEAVSLGVVPAGAMVPGSGSFIVFTPADGSARQVVIEHVHGRSTISAEEDVARFEAEWGRLWVAAVTGEDAVALIRSWE